MDEYLNSVLVILNEACACVVLILLLNDWYKSVLKFEILDTCIYIVFLIVFDVVKSNFMVFWNF